MLRTYKDAKNLLMQTYSTPERIQVKRFTDIEAKTHSEMCDSAMEACKQGDVNACKIACDDCGITEACKPTTLTPLKIKLKMELPEYPLYSPKVKLTPIAIPKAKPVIVPEVATIVPKVKLPPVKVHVKSLTTQKPLTQFLKSTRKPKRTQLYKPKYKKMSVVTRTVGKDGHVRLTKNDMKHDVIRIRY